MSQTRSSGHFAEIHAGNIGGIDETTVSFSPDVTILTGRNATNRTSFLQTVMAALGSDHVSLKGDADEGEVELTLGDKDGKNAYTRTLEREHGTVVMSGEPYLENSESADLFGFLLENNEARQAVARNADLREVIMRPVDTDAIQAEITQLETRKRDLDEQLDKLESLDDRLPDLEAERTRLEDQIEDKQAELEATEADIEDADETLDDTREQKTEFEDALDELQSARSELNEVHYRLDTQRESIQALEDEREEIAADLEDLSETLAGDTAELDAEIERLREHKRSLESTISQLQRVLQFNETMLDGDNPELQTALQDSGRADTSTSDDDGALTDQLLDDEDITVCWTCGSEVERIAIDDTLENLRSLREEKFHERNDVTTELDELTDTRSQRKAERDRHQRLERKLDDIDREIAEREETINELTDERERLEAEIETHETDVDALETQDQDHSELLDLHKEANQFEFELGRFKTDLEDVTNEIESVNEDIEKRERLEDERADVQEELADLRTRIEQLEAEAVEEFNDHMETILGVLAYENIERIWIERTQQEVQEGRRTVERTAFDLHVVRRAESGATYEDTVSHLSESEREVTGLVFALAGYLVHDLHETLPFMVLDSLEALDSDRIAMLVEYFSEYVEYLVVALLPEDATELSADYQRITEI